VSRRDYFLFARDRKPNYGMIYVGSWLRGVHVQSWDTMHAGCSSPPSPSHPPTALILSSIPPFIRSCTVICGCTWNPYRPSLSLSLSFSVFLSLSVWLSVGMHAFLCPSSSLFHFFSLFSFLFISWSFFLFVLLHVCRSWQLILKKLNKLNIN